MRGGNNLLSPLWFAHRHSRQNSDATHWVAFLLQAIKGYPSSPGDISKLRYKPFETAVVAAKKTWKSNLFCHTFNVSDAAPDLASNDIPTSLDSPTGKLLLAIQRWRNDVGALARLFRA